MTLNKQEVANLIRGDVFVDSKTRDEFSEDTSLFKVIPEMVVKPKNAEDISRLVEYVAEQRRSGREGISLTPRSGGTCMSGGSLSDSIVIDFKEYMNELIEVNAEKKTATVQPGMYFRDFHGATLKKDLLMPAYPASWQICAVGGMVGNNAGGEKTLVYGKVENFVPQMKAVFADGKEYVVEPLSKSELEAKMAQGNFEGEVYKKLFELITKNEKVIKAAKPDVSKNSAGYFLWNVWDGETFDLTKLLVGSQGTLAITTEITFRLVPEKKVSRLLIVFLKDLKDLGNMIVKLREYNPETIESYDDKTLKLAIRFAPDLIKLLNTKNIFLVAWHLLPEFFMMRSGMPKLVLMAEFTGDDEGLVLEQVKKAQTAFESAFSKTKTRITSSDDERDELFLIRRQSFNLLRKKVNGKHTAPFIDDFAVRPEYLPEFLPQLDVILNQYKSLIFTIAGHPGDGNFHIIPLMN